MSPASSAERGTRAAETSTVLSAGGSDLFIDGWYVLACALSPPGVSPTGQARARTRFITASGSASAGTCVRTRPASAGGSVPAQNPGPAATPQRPGGSLPAGPAAAGPDPIQTATPATRPCGQAAAASVRISTAQP